MAASKNRRTLDEDGDVRRIALHTPRDAVLVRSKASFARSDACPAGRDARDTHREAIDTCRIADCARTEALE